MPKSALTLREGTECYRYFVFGLVVLMRMVTVATTGSSVVSRRLGLSGQPTA